MSAAALPKAKVRAATAEDFDAVYPLLQELNSTRFTREIWQRLFTNLWQQDDWCPGYVLDNGEEVVGFLGGLNSTTELNDEVHTVCNLTAWIVKDEYRSNSIMLLMPFLKRKNTSLTSLTSSPEAYKVYKKLGFKDVDSECRIIYPLPSITGKYRVISDREKVLQALSQQEEKVFSDHEGLDVKQLVISDRKEHCYLLITRRLGRGHIHKISNVELFRKAIGAVSRTICKSINVKSLQVDERFLEGQKILLSRKKAFSQPKQVRGLLPPVLVDAAYSELSVLATK
ncbi:hypothetical protein GZ77_24115 [Endozoicomonas montiporae]|uniref:N-acetyltransferase domain-containing protein n=2 Tax=Endozoicomonas montiporae TaxID=1027273 RepID=A0A081MZI9_9GAMM|nr:hypothetical protein [Endozoicomonas montiporae]AMO54706.1 hypothetical protein EZMO1_0455 [Endozoicomonas montiporae CL-33]KEQ11612.1 hypothetical protein GZ77_24115 [Endozoicomonas montiporae]